MDPYDDTLSPDDLAMKGVGMIGAALKRSSQERGRTDAANLAKSCLSAIHAAGIDYMETISPAEKTLDDLLEDDLRREVEFSLAGWIAP